MKNSIIKISEKQKIFQKIITEAKKKNPSLKLETIKKIIRRIDPDFLKDMNEKLILPVQQSNHNRCVCGIRDCMDTGKDHSEGFEIEEMFHEVLWGAIEECPDLKASTIKMIIAHVVPKISERLFQTRPCVRKLKYIGRSDDDSFFKVEKIYKSFDFTGATYSFKGYDNGKSRIGSCYFEWID